MKYLVIDTNIPLSNADNILTLGGDDTTVVVPETVLAELDSKKSGFEEINYQARAAARILSSGKVIDIARLDNINITTIEVDSNKILIVGLNEYVANPAEYGGNDQRIIETALALQKEVHEVELMSIDFYMRLRAQGVGLTTVDLKIVDEVELEFLKEVEILDDEVFRILHDKPISSIDKEYKLGNYSYRFTNPNTEQVKLATVQNGLIKVLGKDTEKSLRLQRCAPINQEQLLASKAIQDPSIDLIMIEGQAGSGKNIVAMSNAIRLVETNKDKYSSIVYLRTPHNDEQLGEDIGYVSGNDEKYAIYLGAADDTIDFIVRHEMKKKANETIEDLENRIDEAKHNLISKCSITSTITTGLRGRTFHNAVVILDEWQNASQATAQKVLTRIGKNCKVIVTGSQKQIDNKYITKYNNGLAVLMNEAMNNRVETNISMFAIELQKVVRSDMAKFAEDLFTKE